MSKLIWIYKSMSFALRSLASTSQHSQEFKPVLSYFSLDGIWYPVARLFPFNGYLPRIGPNDSSPYLRAFRRSDVNADREMSTTNWTGARLAKR
jgi:hypothetical protein